MTTIFKCAVGTEDSPIHIAKHLAAHAVVALRAKFRVEQIELHEPAEQGGSVACDWKQARASYNDDAKLINRGFALVYVGTILDQKRTDSDAADAKYELKSEMEAAEDARQTAVEWELVASVGDTNPFAHLGYKLASRIIRQDEALIDLLARELVAKKSIDESSLLAWYKENAPPISLDELERTTTY